MLEGHGAPALPGILSLRVNSGLGSRFVVCLDVDLFVRLDVSLVVQIGGGRRIGVGIRGGCVLAGVLVLHVVLVRAVDVVREPGILGGLRVNVPVLGVSVSERLRQRRALAGVLRGRIGGCVSHRIARGLGYRRASTHQRRLGRTHGDRGISQLLVVADLLGQSLDPAGCPPVVLAQHVHHGGDQQQADDGGVQN